MRSLGMMRRTRQPACYCRHLPSVVWADIAMDFIEALPRVNGKTVILTVVDRFSKFAHFIPLGHLYTTASVAKAFFQDIVRLHRIAITEITELHHSLSQLVATPISTGCNPLPHNYYWYNRLVPNCNSITTGCN